MTQVDSKKLINHLEAKWRDRGCQQCGVAQWQVQGQVFELREFQHGNMVIGGPLIPIVPITCGNCGNTVLVNAIVAGVMDRQEASK